jgi:glycosyltransferase involved in cell wall biosynthesis
MRPVAIGVVVPARNEAGHIGACLDALERSVRTAVAGGVAAQVVVVDDAGTDATDAIAARALGRGGSGRAGGPWGSVLRVAERNVGAARRAGMAHLLRHFEGVAPQQLWLASTDADTIVPVGWLTRQIRLASAGWDGVAGVVGVEEWSRHHPEAQALFERSYGRRVGRLEHGHVHGANLGVRASAYLAAGGFRPLHSAEEHDLWRRLDRPGVRRLTDPGLHVITSSRQRGRVQGGFSGDLADLNTRLAEAG